MADDVIGTVNNQITDAVTQIDTTVVGSAPAQTTGMLDAVLAESLGMAMYNAVTTQHNAQMVASAAVAAACARMLKSPIALPPLPSKLVSPAVSSSSPAPVPVNANTQNVQLIGSNFQAGLTVNVFDEAGTQIGTLDGSQQIGNVTSTSLTMMTNLFSASGSYGVEVVNPDGGSSSRYIVTATLFPVVTGVTGSPSTYTVSGSNFQAGLTGSNVSVFDQEGIQLPAPKISALNLNATPQSFSMVIVPGSSSGPFSVEVVNPDGGESNLYTFDATAT